MNMITSGDGHLNAAPSPESLNRPCSPSPTIQNPLVAVQQPQSAIQHPPTSELFSGSHPAPTPFSAATSVLPPLSTPGPAPMSTAPPLPNPISHPISPASEPAPVPAVTTAVAPAQSIPVHYPKTSQALPLQPQPQAQIPTAVGPPAQHQQQHQYTPPGASAPPPVSSAVAEPLGRRVARQHSPVTPKQPHFSGQQPSSPSRQVLPNIRQPAQTSWPSPALQGHPSKPPIMDPPSGRQRLSGNPGGFPSPNTSNRSFNGKFSEDVQRMSFAVGQCIPGAVRRVIRDNWEKCLLGSEFHQAFLLNVSIHHTSGQIIRRSIKDFGSRMVSEARNELVSLLSTHDYDDLASVILENASDSFLDQALEKRLRTIEARPLINALANAGRLGYDPSDIIEQDSKSERVIPGQPAGHPSGCTSDGRWNCTMCGRFFPAESAYKHHVNKKVCEKEPPNAKGFSHSCTYCGQCFTTIVGLQYHNANKVCGDFGQATKLVTNVISAEPTNGHSSSPSTPLPGDMKNLGHAPTQSQASQFKPSQSNPSLSQPSQSLQVQQTPSQPVGSTIGASANYSHSPSALNLKYSSSYEHLGPEQRDALIRELRQAEQKYGERMRLAEAITAPGERLYRLEALKNSFSTKQSMIRKKYGVRLRERRSRAKMEEERQQLGIQTAAMMSNAAIQKAVAEMESGEGQESSSADGPRRSSGWTAANTSSGLGDQGDVHADKRQRTAIGSATTSYGSQRSESPKRRGLTVSEMGGGLGESPATAATLDPTLQLKNGTSSPSQARVTPSLTAAGAHVRGDVAPYPGKDETDVRDVPIDEESSDDNDIPAEIPPRSQRTSS